MRAIPDARRRKAKRVVDALAKETADSAAWSRIGALLQQLRTAAEADDADAFDRALDALSDVRPRGQRVRGKRIPPREERDSPPSDLVGIPEYVNELVRELTPKLGPPAPKRRLWPSRT